MNDLYDLCEYNLYEDYGCNKLLLISLHAEKYKFYLSIPDSAQSNLIVRVKS